jgi:hypothetical protein
MAPMRHYVVPVPVRQFPVEIFIQGAIVRKTDFKSPL